VKTDAIAYVDEGLRIGNLLKKHIRRVVRKSALDKPELTVLYFFVVKNLTTLGAVRTLWESKFSQDASVLVRSIFEAYVQFLYIRTDPVKLSERYLAHEAVSRLDFSTAIIRSYKDMSARTKKKWVEAAREFGRESKSLTLVSENSRGWAGKSTREMARLLDRKGWKGTWADYEVFYGLASKIAHSSAMSMQEYLKLAQPGGSYQQLSNRRKYLEHVPLLACFWCLIMVRLTALDHNRVAKDYDLARLGLDTEGFLLNLRGVLER
jgi:Family of unknown function (DUF5677)